MIQTNNDSLAIALNLSTDIDNTVLEGELVEFKREVKQKVKDLEYERDLNLVKKNLVDLITRAGPMAADLIGILVNSQNPRMMDSIAGIIKTVADINKDLLEVSEKKHLLFEIEHAEAPINEAQPSNGVTQNNAFFVGSTEDLFKLINGKKNTV